MKHFLSVLSQYMRQRAGWDGTRPSLPVISLLISLPSVNLSGHVSGLVPTCKWGRRLPVDGGEGLRQFHFRFVGIYRQLNWDAVTERTQSNLDKPALDYPMLLGPSALSQIWIFGDKYRVKWSDFHCKSSSLPPGSPRESGLTVKTG